MMADCSSARVGDVVTVRGTVRTIEALVPEGHRRFTVDVAPDSAPALEPDGMSLSQLAIYFAQKDLDEARQLLQEAVDEARTLGLSWADVGEALGITRQAAWERFAGGAR